MVIADSLAGVLSLLALVLAGPGVVSACLSFFRPGWHFWIVLAGVLVAVAFAVYASTSDGGDMSRGVVIALALIYATIFLAFWVAGIAAGAWCRRRHNRASTLAT